MDDSEQIRLRTMLEKVEGPASVTVQRAITGHWGRLCWIADDYGRGPCLETWKDAEAQWGHVANVTRSLIEALNDLGMLACAIRLDAAVEAPEGYEAIKDCLPVVPGEMPVSRLDELEVFALRAQRHSQAMKKQCNGARREDNSGPRDALFARILGLLNCPKAHAQEIAAAIHAWERREEYRPGSRFAERSTARVKPLR